jgi:tRNA (guanosine-2'-O-)-methyltransferase
LLLAYALLACDGDAPPRSAVDVRVVDARDVRADGMALVMSCTPSGPERCFDGIDDNCNGLIDEGCGVPAGTLQFVLAWGDSPADLEIALVDPNGNRISETQRTRAGFVFHRDCPKQACFGQNLEVITFDGNDPPKGYYVVEVRMNDLGGAPLPVRARLGARVGSRSFGADIVLDAQRDRRTLMFQL